MDEPQGCQAGNGARTRDPQLGKLMLCQLSYSRGISRNRDGRCLPYSIPATRAVSSEILNVPYRPIHRSGFKRLLFIEPFQRKLDQPVDQVAVGDSGDLPQLGKHADPCETGDGVEFIYQDLAVFPEEEIDP